MNDLTDDISTAWIVRPRSDMGLTQACHQLRHEFLPIVQSKSIIGIKLHELPRYFNECIASMFQDRAVAKANIVVDSMDTPVCKVDLLPFILFRRAAPHVSVAFDEYKAVKLFNFEQGSKWHTYMSRCVSKVVCCVTSIGDCPCCYLLHLQALVAYVKAEFTENWMSSLAESQSIMYGEEKTPAQIDERRIWCDGYENWKRVHGVEMRHGMCWVCVEETETKE
jgi:hypothetical protein